MKPPKTDYFQNCLGVFQGGGVKGIALAGAYQEAVKRGVFFSELAGASAGSIVAVLIAAGATPKQLMEILWRLDFESFLIRAKRNKTVKWRYLSSALTIFWHKSFAYRISAYFSRLGFYDASIINDWIDKELKLLIGTSETVLFKDLFLPVSIVTTDLNTKKIKVWSYEETPDFPVGRAVQMSCSIPFFFQPYENRYVDGGMLSNLPAFLLRSDSLFDRVLGFGFSDPKIHENVRSGPKLFTRLMDAAIDGATDIQMKLQTSVPIIQIETDGIAATDFDKINEEAKRKLIKNGRDAAIHFFDTENEFIEQEHLNQNIARDTFGSFNLILKCCLSNPREISIMDDQGVWVYSLFPLLLKWNATGVKVRIILKERAEDQHQRSYKLRLLKELGFAAEEIQTLPFKGFIFDGTYPESSAVILKAGNDSGIIAKFYTGREDALLIGKLLSEFNNNFKGKTITAAPAKLIQVINDDLFRKLQNVNQYRGKDVRFEIKEVDIKDVVFMTKFLKGYKYRMMESIFDLYASTNMPIFAPAALKFASGQTSIMTPPILERNKNKYVIIEGNARLIYAARNGLSRVHVIVVSGVKEALPSRGAFDYRKIVISDKNKIGVDRYEGFKPARFRHIEASIRDPQTALI